MQAVMISNPLKLCVAILLQSLASHLRASAFGQKEPQFWAYSLVATDYDGHKMLPFFLEHYRKLGVKDNHFHFDLLHDPDEPDTGLKVGSQTKPSTITLPCLI